MPILPSDGERSDLENRLDDSSGIAGKLKDAYYAGAIPLGNYIVERADDYKHELKKAWIHLRTDGFLRYAAFRKERKFRAKRLKEYKLREFRAYIAKELKETTGFNDWIVAKLAKMPEPYVEGEFARLGKVARNLSMAVAFSATGIHGLPEEYLDAMCTVTSANRKFQKVAALGFNWFWGLAPAFVANQLDLSTETLPGMIAWGYLLAGVTEPVVRTSYYVKTRGHHLRSFMAHLNVNYVVMGTAWAVTGHQILRKYNSARNGH